VAQSLAPVITLTPPFEPYAFTFGTDAERIGDESAIRPALALIWPLLAPAATARAGPCAGRR
jgi:hypothetical protein